SLLLSSLFFFSIRRPPVFPSFPYTTLFRSDPLPILCFHASKSWRFFYGSFYYPSECHADYFDFERIEALKPAIEACGISTLSQSQIGRASCRERGWMSVGAVS